MARARHRRTPLAFTLLEVVWATTILSGAVVAVTWAVSSGQAHALEAQQSIAATLLAEELMGEHTSKPYVNIAGETLTQTETFWYTVQVVSSNENISELGVVISGKHVTVMIKNQDLTRDLAVMERFVPAPP